MDKKESKILAGRAILISALFILFTTGNSYGAETIAGNSGWLEQKISVNCQDCEMQDVLQKISLKLGITIIYDGSLSKVPISCDYTSTAVEKIINRIFRNYNKGVIIEPDSKTMIIQTFGAYDYVMASAKEKSKKVSMPFLGEMANKELVELHKKQYAQYQKEMKDENAIVPGLGISRGELRENQTKQYKEYKEQLNDPDAIVPELGITRKELNDLHKKQNREYREALITGESKSDGL